MQVEELNQDVPNGTCMHYMGIFLEDDTNRQKLETQVAGKIMSGWWDGSNEAGDARRPRASFSEPVPQLDVLTIGEDHAVRTPSKNQQYLNLFNV